MTNFTMLVRDRPILTAQALCSLERRPRVTIMDDRSNPGTSELLKGWCTATSNHYVRNEEPRGTGPLRNLVISESEKYFDRGEYLYLSDNDTVFLPGWLEVLTECYRAAWKYGFRILGGYSHPFNQSIPNEQWIKVGMYDVQPIYALATQSMFMSWEVWDQFGPFCETPVDKVCQSEDVAFSNKIREAGYKVGVVSPALIVSTGITNTFGEKIPGWELVKAQAPAGVIVE